MNSRRRSRPPERRVLPPSDADRLLGVDGASVVDLLDRLLSKGAVVTGDVTLGVAGVDLVYLRLSALLCAVDRVLTPRGTRAPSTRKRPTGRRRTAPARPGEKPL